MIEKIKTMKAAHLSITGILINMKVIHLTIGIRKIRITVGVLTVMKIIRTNQIAKIINLLITGIIISIQNIYKGEIVALEMTRIILIEETCKADSEGVISKIIEEDEVVGNINRMIGRTTKTVGTMMKEIEIVETVKIVTGTVVRVPITPVIMHQTPIGPENVMQKIKINAKTSTKIIIINIITVTLIIIEIILTIVTKEILKVE